MGAYLARPVKTKISLYEENEELGFGVSSMQGWRLKQEDAHNCILNFDENCSLFGVYDGHGGFEVAKYTSEELPDFIKNTEEYKSGNYKEALISAFLGFDDTIPSKKVAARLTEIKSTDKSDAGSEAEDYDQNEEADRPQSSCSRANDEDYDDDEDPEMNAPDTLRRDASRPIEEVVAAYCVPSMARLIAGERKPASPYLRGRRDTALKGECSSSFTSECSTSFVVSAGGSGSSSSSSVIVECSSSSGGNDAEAAEKAEKKSENKDSDKNETPVNGHACENEKVNAEPEGSLVKETCKSPAKISKNSSSNEAALLNGSASPVNGDIGGDGGESEEAQNSTEAEENSASSNTPTKKKKLALTDLDDSDVVKNFITSDEIDESDEEDSEDETFQLDECGRVKNDSEDDDDDDDDDDDAMDFITRLEKRYMKVVRDEEDNSATSSEYNEDEENEENLEEEEDDDEEESLESSDSDEDEDFCIGDKPGIDSGCTAVVALIKGNNLYVANAGDSRCVVSKDGVAIDMSEDHKPEDTIERNRIVKAGGNVTSDGRVNGGLNLSRAIGDHGYKKNTDLPNTEQMITALPDVREFKIDSNVEFIVLACDGIWNSMSSQEVVNFINPRIKSKQKLSEICEELFEKCLAPNTLGDGTGCDNMTCIIIKPFHGNGVGGSAPSGTNVKTSCDSSGNGEQPPPPTSVDESKEAEEAVAAVAKKADEEQASEVTSSETTTSNSVEPPKERVSQKRSADSSDDDQLVLAKREKTDDGNTKEEVDSS